MKVRPIKTEADYYEALERIEKLMDTVPGTHEEEELDLLASLIVAYERIHYPIKHPSEFERPDPARI